MLNGIIGDKTGQRILTSIGGLVAATVGVILMVALPLDNNIGRLIGYYMTQAFPTAFVALLSLISSNVAGYTKKTTVAALYLIGYCTGNIIGIYNHHHLARVYTDCHRPTDLPSPRCTSLCFS